MSNMYSVVVYLYIKGSGSITSVGEERANLSAVVYLYVIMWFLFGEVSSSSGCLGWATLFYCGTPLAFHIIILRRLPLLKLANSQYFLSASFARIIGSLMRLK